MKRVLLLSLGLLLLCFPLTGCDSEEGLASEQIALIVEEVGAGEPDTCTFDMDISGTVEVEGLGQSMKMSIVGGGEGCMDNVNQDMYMPLTMTMNANIPGLGNESEVMSMKTYVKGGWLYMYMDGEWTKMGSTAAPGDNSVSIPINDFSQSSVYAVMASTRPAQFSVTDLSIVPGEINVGEGTTISCMVTNTGDLTASYEAILRINDVARETSEIVLNGNASQSVSFSITQDAAGEYTVSIGGLSGRLEVKEPVGEVAAAPEPKPPEPKPPVKEEPVTPAPPPEEEPKELPVEPEANYWYWWLIGAVVVIVIVGLLYYQFRWRKQKA